MSDAISRLREVVAIPSRETVAKATFSERLWTPFSTFQRTKYPVIDLTNYDQAGRTLHISVTAHGTGTGKNKELRGLLAGETYKYFSKREGKEVKAAEILAVWHKFQEGSAKLDRSLRGLSDDQLDTLTAERDGIARGVASLGSIGKTVSDLKISESNLRESVAWAARQYAILLEKALNDPSYKGVREGLVELDSHFGLPGISHTEIDLDNPNSIAFHLRRLGVVHVFAEAPHGDSYLDVRQGAKVYYDRYATYTRQRILLDALEITQSREYMQDIIDEMAIRGGKHIGNLSQRALDALEPILAPTPSSINHLAYLGYRYGEGALIEGPKAAHGDRSKFEAGARALAVAIAQSRVREGLDLLPEARYYFGQLVVEQQVTVTAREAGKAATSSELNIA